MEPVHAPLFVTIALLRIEVPDTGPVMSNVPALLTAALICPPDAVTLPLAVLVKPPLVGVVSVPLVMKVPEFEIVVAPTVPLFVKFPPAASAPPSVMVPAFVTVPLDERPPPVVVTLPPALFVNVPALIAMPPPNVIIPEFVVTPEFCE